MSQDRGRRSERDQLHFEIGVNEGQRQALLKAAYDDTGLVEVVRVRSWVRRYPALCKAEGENIVVPAEWPVGVDWEEEVLAALNGK